MSCESCSCWKISEFTYQELCEKWNELIGGPITPGYKKRFKKEGVRLGIPAERVVMPFKYCLKGKLNRFYVVKHANDTRPGRKINDCPGFTTATIGIDEFPVPSPLWSICAKETHAPSRVRGQIFYPGLTEQGTYLRIPGHGNIRPILIHENTCDICGKEFARGIEVREVIRFCCNRHYLQWWKDRHPQMYAKLNRTR